MTQRSLLKNIQTNRLKPSIFVPIVVGSVTIATIVRLSLSPLLGSTGAAYVLYFIAVFASALLIGFRGGASASLLSLIAGTWLFFRPTGAHGHWKSSQFFDVAVVVLEWLIVSALGHMQIAQSTRADQKAVELQASEEHLRVATEGANIGTWRWNIAASNLTCSEKLLQLFGEPTGTATDSQVLMDAIHEHDRDMYRSAVAAAIETCSDFDIEIRVIWPDASVHWLVVRGHVSSNAFGAPTTIEGVAIDITQRKRAEQEAEERARRADSLNVIGKAVREMRDPSDIHEIALVELAKTLHLDRCLVILLDTKRDHVHFVAEWHREDQRDLKGNYSLADFDVDLKVIFSGSLPLVVSDIDDHALLSPVSAQMLKSLDIRALINVPMVHGDEIVSVLGAYVSDGPRQWLAEEISFVESVASQLTAAFEAVRVLKDAQNRADREELINRISDEIRNTLDPEEIQLKTVSILGEALKADRCYFAVYDLGSDEITVVRDWHRPDLPSIKGVHHFSNTNEILAEHYQTNSASVIVDRETAPLSEGTKNNMLALQLRSRVSAAIADPNGSAILIAGMAESPRDWKPEEIQLIEKVAAQLRVSIELARVQLREHRIAGDLQTALMPRVPETAARLEFGSCMRPALDEAEIGGDFLDVFALGEDRYALIVGDVSGKGLAAAGQLAMVRNCLRMSFYEHQEPARALKRLNSIITTNELLTGFVTVLAIVYDDRTRMLTCASCGHEPALLRRADTGRIEIVTAHGFPLGVDAEADYLQNIFRFSDGDTLLMYTDGLSESGPSRREMLGTKGLVEIFESIDGNLGAQLAATELVNQVESFTGAPLRDDACVLIARCVS